jgi:uncharacterized membrane protein HdeD (DUF308 family)
MKRASWFSIALSILLIVCGCLGILLPVETSFGVAIVASWLLMISGFMHFLSVFRCKGIGDGIWKALISLVYIATGFYLRLNLGHGIVALTLALIVFLVSQGLIDIFGYFRMRNSGVSSWILLNGAISLILGLMVWRHWPSGSLWVVGTLVGVNMIVTGTTRLMLSVAARRAARSSVGPYNLMTPPDPISHSQ